MATKVRAGYLRVSPRKTRKVIDLIRGLPVLKATAILEMTNKGPVIYVKRLLNSAIDSADKRLNISPADLYISSIRADGGPTLKRYRAASMGRATTIRHRTTHIILELEEIKRPEKKRPDKKDIGREPEKKKKTPDKKTARKINNA